MDEPINIRLFNPQQAFRAITEAWQMAKASLMAGTRLVLVIRAERRSLDQNAHFHALCADLAKSQLTWVGKRRNADEWKVLLVSGHAMATKEGVEMVPGLEGEFLNIRESTARMSVKRAASLIEYTLAFCANHGVVPQAGKQWEGYR